MGRTVAIAAILFLWSRFAVADLPIPEAAKDATDRYQTAIAKLSRLCLEFAALAQVQRTCATQR
jgi:hypothetical protein